MLRYPVSIPPGGQKAILVKIRRHPKMTALHQTVQANIHQYMHQEFETLEFIFEGLASAGADFGAIRPLHFMEKYHAILMEEYPSRTLRQLLDQGKSTRTNWDRSELKDAARKTGRWLYYFHNHLNTSQVREYTVADILLEVQEYAERIERSTRRRILSRPILDAFGSALRDIQLEHVRFSQTHSDMTANNVLYSKNGKICIIDVKNRPAPVYVDLGLILTYPETSKPQIYSGGRYYPESLLRKYRAEIVAGYFEEEPGGEILARIYCAVKVLDKWRMYEELMGRYKGYKRALSIPMAPFVSAYFQNLLKKYLGRIGNAEFGQVSNTDKATAESSIQPRP
jgi:hypothetical protein